MMNVLVTGGAGYIGSHVVEELQKNGFTPIVYDNLSTGHVAAVPEEVQLVEGDIHDVAFLKHIMAQFEIDAVIHFAASSLVGESMENPSKYYFNNVEDSCLNPTNVYGRTKLMIEKMLADYDMAYEMRYVALRYFNAAGASPSRDIGEDHDPESHLIPLVLKTAQGVRRQVAIYGTDYATADGTCVRDYVHVCDLATAHVLALKHLLAGGASRVYNLGSENGFSVREIIDAAKKITGIDFTVVEESRRSGDPAVLIASSEKIRDELGWVPKCSTVNEVISTAWKWHKGHPQGYEG